ncbi:MAG: sodium:proton antiporter [Bacteroidales bacterium]|nr:sodium:proton antiporter [Bacteroidales bacterium]
MLNSKAKQPPLGLSILPIASLLIFLACVVIFAGASAISDYSPYALLASAILSVVLACCCGSLCRRGIIVGFRRSAAQILPAVPMLICIAMVSTTWMLSGVVPTLIDYGLALLSPVFFLVLTCVVCGVISVLTGSSWSTIATIGVAFMGIGTVMGFNPGLVAGAIISGAYFGDKVSPLSDTTVVASSTCGVDLFEHIRYLALTAAPAMAVALLVFFVAGLHLTPESAIESGEIRQLLADNFNISPYTLVIPLITAILIALRVRTIITLFVSSMLGLVGIFIFQPELAARLLGEASGLHTMILGLLWGETSFNTGVETFDSLVTTSGILGMLPTVRLVLCAMLFGTAMIGTGMLSRLTHAITRHIRRRFTLVGSTVAGGLFLNSCTADQYLSIIIGGNMFRNAYRRFGLEPRLLSRSLEDSVSVTSVLIPWNSCGVTQSAVLGVATLSYLPYCVFNYLSPLLTLLFALTGIGIKQAAHAIGNNVPAFVRIGRQN